MVNHDIRANAALGTVLLLLAVVGVASVIGYSLAGPASGASSAVTASANGTAVAETATPAGEPLNLTVIHEQWNESIYVSVTGGDLSIVQSFTVDGADLNGSLDPDAARPEATGTVDPPATVVLEAHLTDGRTRVVARIEI